MLGGLFVFSSCEQEEEVSAGVPVIERVRLTDPSTADSTLSGATLGSTLAIVGRNLANTNAVYLNNYRVQVNPAYATNTHLIVQISDSVNTVATNPNVPNEVRVINPYGEATYNFQVLPPAPQVGQIGNEFVQEGETLRIYGNYFYFVDTVHFPGGDPAEDDVFVTDGFTTNSSGTVLTVTVPEGFNPTIEENNLIVVSRSGRSNASRTSRFSTGHGIFADFDTNDPFEWPQNGAADWGWGIGNENFVTSAPGIEPVDGYFAMINATIGGNWAWNNNKVINLVDWGAAQIYPTTPEDMYDPSQPISNFEARMEVAVNTSASIEGLELQVWTQDENNTELTVNVPLTDYVHSTDGRWYTLTVPLRDLASGNTRFGTYGDFIAGNANGERHFRIVIVNPTPEGIPLVMGIDNVRIVNAVYAPAGEEGEEGEE